MSRLAVGALACALLCSPLSAGAKSEDKPTLIVMGFQVGKGIAPETAKLLSDLMLAEFQKVGSHKVFGQEDITSMLTLEQTKIQTGCADDSCLAEIGGALGASFLVSSSVGRVGSKYLLNVKMIDVKRAQAVARSSQITEGQEENLLAAIQTAVRELLGLTAPPVEKKVEPAPPVEKKVEPAPAVEKKAEPALQAEAQPGGRSTLWNVAPWGAAGAAVALAAGGIVSAVLAGKSFDELEKTPATDPGKRSDLKDKTDKRALAADVLLAVAGAAAVTSVLLFILRPSDKPEATATVLPVQGGMVVGLRGTLPEWGW